MELMEYLFNTSNYDKRIIPSVGQEVNVPMNVSIGLALQQIENLVCFRLKRFSTVIFDRQF